MTAASSAIRLGFEQTASRWASSLFAVLASIAEVLAGLTALLGGIAWLDDHHRASGLAFGAAIAGLLTARILLALVQGGAIRQSGAWLKGQSIGTTLETLFAAAPQSLAWFAWTLPIELLGACWKWLGLFAVVYAYGHALSAKSSGCAASLAFAAFACLSIPLAVGWAALSRATFVWTVRRAVSPFHAATDAFVTLLKRPGAFISVLITGFTGIAIVSVVISLFASGLSPEEQGLEHILASQLATGVLIAFASALFELVILYAFTALEGDSAVGTLPTAPRA